jgi:hypothetical protein
MTSSSTPAETIALVRLLAWASVQECPLIEGLVAGAAGLQHSLCNHSFGFHHL